MTMLHKILLALCLLLHSIAPAAAAFSDAGGSQYAVNIDALEVRGLVKGYNDGTFRPFQVINRAEFLKIIMDALKVSVADTPGACFSDVAAQWFAPYVCKAAQMGFIKGYPDGTFRAGQSINMVEAQKIVAAAFDLAVKEPKQGEDWFTPYVDFFHDNTFFSKYSYLPSRPFRREEMALLVDYVLQWQEGKRALSSVRFVGSAGCGKKAPGAAPHEFSVSGTLRTAITVIPKGYDANKPTALIFAFHGRTNSNERARSYFGLERATNEQAIIVYPAGNQTGSTYNWSNSYPLFDVMLRELKNAYCINADEVFAVGHSLGAWFANDLACARADVIRAVGSLGGGRNAGSCTGPVAAMVLHNPKDNLAPFSGGVGARDSYLRQNALLSGNAPSEPAWGNCVAYTEGHVTSPLIWCPHTIDTERDGTYYPHVWPRETGQAMWTFFTKLPK